MSWGDLDVPEKLHELALGEASAYREQMLFYPRILVRCPWCDSEVMVDGLGVCPACEVDMRNPPRRAWEIDDLRES